MDIFDSDFDDWDALDFEDQEEEADAMADDLALWGAAALDTFHPDEIGDFSESFLEGYEDGVRDGEHLASLDDEVQAAFESDEMYDEGYRTGFDVAFGGGLLNEDEDAEG